MSDRINAITIVLEEDIRDDDIKEIMTAIGMIRGVASACPNVADVGDYVARIRAIRPVREQLFKLIEELGP